MARSSFSFSDGFYFIYETSFVLVCTQKGMNPLELKRARRKAFGMGTRKGITQNWQQGKSSNQKTQTNQIKQTSPGIHNDDRCCVFNVLLPQNSFNNSL